MRAAETVGSFSWRETADTYEVLAAEILLEKTVAEKVEPIYDERFATCLTPDALVDAERNNWRISSARLGS